MERFVELIKLIFFHVIGFLAHGFMYYESLNIVFPVVIQLSSGGVTIRSRRVGISRRCFI